MKKKNKIFKKKIICLICCRGGSKKIKNKNIKLFHNKPLVYWILDEIKKSNIFDEIIISTDSIKIKNIILKRYKVTVPGLRPKYLATSTSNQFDTHKHVFKKMNLNDQNSLICVLNNNPFISSEYIKKSFSIFKKNNFKKIVCDYAEVDGDYIMTKQFLFKSNLFFPLKKQYLKLKLNRQELKSFYTFIYNIRWGKPSDLKNYYKFKKRFLNNPCGIKLSKIDNFDIDDKEDWKIAEAVFQIKNND